MAKPPRKRGPVLTPAQRADILSRVDAYVKGHGGTKLHAMAQLGIVRSDYYRCLNMKNKAPPAPIGEQIEFPLALIPSRPLAKPKPIGRPPAQPKSPIGEQDLLTQFFSITLRLLG